MPAPPSGSPCSTYPFDVPSSERSSSRSARRALADQDLEAVAVFEEAYAIDPESPEAFAWLDKTRRKLSWHWLETALELHANDDLEQAVPAYEQALKYSPNDRGAQAGYATAVAGLEFRALRGRGYFNEGLRALSEYWLEQARSRFAYAGKYEPTDPRPKERGTQVNELLAKQRVAIARQLEKSRRYNAARGEYRAATLLDPSNEDAKVGKERCAAESRAYDLLRDARMAILRGWFDKAASLIEQGLAITQAQQDLFEGMQASVQEARLQKLYTEGLSYERDLQYELAVKKYAEVLQQTDYYKDVLARKDTLEQYVQLSADLYEKAQAATDKDEKIRYLEQIRLVWPEYKDISAQLKALTAP
jgi:tetratricopeptide (TPR) repeat protein